MTGIKQMFWNYYVEIEIDNNNNATIMFLLLQLLFFSNNNGYTLF